MKKISLLTSFILIFISCTNDDNNSNNTNYNEKIYFDGYDLNVGGQNGKYSEIYSIDTDGSNQLKITNYSNNGINPYITENPSIKDNQIYFSSNKNNTGNGSEIFKINLDGAGLINISNYSNFDLLNPTLFQNGSIILLEKHGFDGNYKYAEIISMNINGSGLTNLTNYPNDGFCSDPIYNITNNRILFSKKVNVDSNYQIWSMELNGSNKIQLTSNDEISKMNAKISPDGSKIVFEGATPQMQNKQSEIFIMNSDGSNITQLTNYSNNGVLDIYTQSPIFSPNGNKIYYTSSISGIKQIYSMNLDGTNKVQITHTPEEKNNLTIN